MIYDCIPFFNELDLLEIRLNVLKDVVDKFIILETDNTHSGLPKPYHLEENWDRFKYKFDISYFQAHLKGNSSWQRENNHRLLLRDCLEPKDKDIVLLSDLDEIPNTDVIKFHLHPQRLVQRMYYFYLNAYANQDWPSGTIMMSGKDAKATDWQTLRMDKSIHQLKDGGWHFSSVGTKENIERKMKSFAHIEYSSDEATKAVLDHYSNLRSIHGEELTIVPIDDCYPQYIQDNQEKYSHLICQSSI